MQLDGYTDFDFQSDIDDRKSTSGFVFICNGSVVSWKSSKQSTTADSTTEAEYIILILISNQISMIESLPLDMCSFTVSWKSSKQSTTADSTTEAEYIAASDAKEFLNRARLQIPLLRLSILLHQMLQRKLFG